MHYVSRSPPTHQEEVDDHVNVSEDGTPEARSHSWFRDSVKIAARLKVREDERRLKLLDFVKRRQPHRLITIVSSFLRSGGINKNT